MTIPPNWPKTGTIGTREISLEEAEKLPPDERAEVVVDVPGVGKIRPWRFDTDADDVQVDEDGTLVI